MGVILTQHLTYNTRTLLVGAIACVANAQHTEEYAAVNRLETIAHIRERTGHNHRHTVVDVRGLHLLLDIDLQNSVHIKCLIFVH